MSLFKGLVKAVFNTAVLFIIIILLTSFQQQVGSGEGDKLIFDTQESVFGFIKLPPQEYIIPIAAVLGVVFLASMIFHHNKKKK